MASVRKRRRCVRLVRPGAAVSLLLCVLAAGCERPTDVSEDTAGAPRWVVPFEYPHCERDQRWVDVATSWLFTCGVRADGCAECWGSVSLANETDTGFNLDYDADEPPDGPFTDIELVSNDGSDGGSNHGCGLRPDGTIACWGRDDYGQASPPITAGFIALEVAANQSCAITSAGTIECWGWEGNDGVPSGAFVDLSGARQHWFALGADGLVRSWAMYGEGFPIPEGTFTALDNGGPACGIRAESAEVYCWAPGGDDVDNLVVQDEPQGRFVDVCILGLTTACALSEDGEVACWGSDYHGETHPPEGPFAAISCGSTHACGLTPDGEVVCWGDNDYGQCDPPP